MTIDHADDLATRALTLLESAAGHVCSATCPSTWRTGNPPPHGRECLDTHQAVRCVSEEIIRLRGIVGGPAWRTGRPDAPGIWVLRMKNRDLITATVRWDEYDDGAAASRYLRIDDGEMSEELDRVEGEIGRWVDRSYGPIPDE